MNHAFKTVIAALLPKATPPPLTAFCMKVSWRTIMNILMTVDPSSEHKRAFVLSMLIMMAAGHFVGSLQWGEQKGMWEGSRRYLRDTNPDVITAEAINWITFLMGRLWEEDGYARGSGKDPEMFERVGYLTLTKAGQLARQVIKSETDFDFKASAIESTRLYSQSKKDGGDLVDPFASVVLRSVGCRSLAEPRKVIDGPLPPLELMPITLNATLFYSTIPSAFYDTFKNMLREWSDRFPHDED